MLSIHTKNLEYISKKLNSSELRCLDKATPLDFFKCKIGETNKTIRYKNRYLHSKIDPWSEGIRKYKDIVFEGYNSVLVLGDGLLYSLEYVLDHFSEKDVQIHIVYPNWNFLKTLIILRDISFLKSYKVYFYINDYDHLFNNIDYWTLKKTLIIENRQMMLFFDKYFSELVKHYYKKIELWYSSALTKFYFERLWVKNALENISFNKNFYTIKDIKNIFFDQKSILVGAGPSLYNCLDDLKKLEDKYYIIACDSALPILLEYNIKIDFVISQDAGYYNYLDYLLKGGKSDIKLVLDVMSYPKIFKETISNEIYFYYSHDFEEDKTSHLMYLFLKEFYLEKVIDGVNSSSTVIHTAINLLKYMGFKSTILMGVDMGYFFFHTHCVSGSHFNYYYQNQGRFSPISGQEFFYCYPSKGDFEVNNNQEKLYMTRQSHIHLNALEQIKEKLINKMKIYKYKSYMISDNFETISFDEMINVMDKREKEFSHHEFYFDIFLQQFKVKIESLTLSVYSFLKKLEKRNFNNFREDKINILEKIKSIPFLNESIDYVWYSVCRSDKDEYTKTYIVLKEIFNYLNILKSRF